VNLFRRNFSRAQAALRGFFGLGPEQFTVDRNIYPGIDVEFLLRGYQDSQLITQISGAVVPGDSGQVNMLVPSAGTWLCHAWGIWSLGPATSGSFQPSCRASLSFSQWGASGLLGLNHPVQLNRPGAAVGTSVGAFLDVPLMLHRSAAGIADGLEFSVLNNNGSVGNLTFTASALFRRIEAVVNP